MPSIQPRDNQRRQRIIVVGMNVATVQRVSSYCLEWGAEVLPYYGMPQEQEIELFDPQLWVICLPVAVNLKLPINAPILIWEEPPTVLQASSTRAELLANLEASRIEFNTMQLNCLQK